MRDSTDTINDYVVTGSYNLANETNDANNVVVVQSHALALAYTMEFEEMWGDNDDTPNPSNARFGKRKTDNTPHHFVIGGIPVDLYFSPSDSATMHLRVDVVGSADQEIDFCIFSFTRQDVSDSMKSRYDNGVLVQGVFDSADWLGPYSESRDMTGDGENPWDPPAPVYPDQVSGMLHHKYMIVDPWEIWDGDPIVETGSMNWSTRGGYKNDENILIIHNKGVANLYLQEFVARYEEAGGTYSGILCGDVTGDWQVNFSDILYLGNYLFNSGPPPNNESVGDVNHDGEINVLDISYLSNFLYFSGPPPCSSSKRP